MIRSIPCLKSRDSVFESDDGTLKSRWVSARSSGASGATGSSLANIHTRCVFFVQDGDCPMNLFRFFTAG